MSSIMPKIHTVFQKWLILPSTEPIDILCAAVVGNRLPGPPLFLVLVGPSGSGKSELIGALSSLRNIYPMGKITPQTFLSGMKDTEGSFLMKLPPNEVSILTFKDLTTTISEREADRAKIMAQLREIYDGELTAAWGTSKYITWSGKLGIISGCTGIYDQAASHLSALGERFLVYRPPGPDPISLAEQAMRSTSAELLMKRDLRQSLKVLDTLKLPTTPIPISYDIRQYLSQLCAFLARLRTPVPRDHRGQVISIPEIESTGRIAKQFAQLIKGLTIIRGLPEPFEDEVNVVERVAISSAPSIRVTLMNAIPFEGCAIRDLSSLTAVPKSVAHRTLEDLLLLDLMSFEGGGYRPNPSYAHFYLTMRQVAPE